MHGWAQGTGDPANSAGWGAGGAGQRVEICLSEHGVYSHLF